MTLRVKALVLDFDGLIVDTETPEFRAWAEVFRENGLVLCHEEWAERLGRGQRERLRTPYDILEERIGRSIDRDEIRRKRRARFAEMLVEETIRPGVHELLDRATESEIRLAIASSSPREWVSGHLTELGIADRFDIVRCEEDVARTKPDPELYTSALAGLEVDSSAAIAFEDSPNGIAAARAAGLYCIAVPNPITRLLDLTAADRVVESLADIDLAPFVDH